MTVTIKTAAAAAPAAAPDDLAALAVAGAKLDGDNAPPPPPGAAPGAAADESGLSTADMLEMAIKPLFLVLAPNWNVSDNEVAMLADAYGKLLDKYFPDLKNAAGPEIAAVMVTSAVLLPRVVAKIPRVKEEKKPETAANAEAQQQP